MGAHSSKEKLNRSYSERYVHSQVIERERFGSFGKRTKGSAKKRDVRNLSISPTDLGPPPKTQQTANGTSTRPKLTTISITQKRLASGGQSATASSGSSNCPTPNGINVGQPKGASTPPTVVKKSGLFSKRLEVKSSSKSTTKDHNYTPATVPPSTLILSNGTKPETPTELQEITNNGLHLHNNNNLTNKSLNSRNTAQCTSPTSPTQTKGKKLAIAADKKSLTSKLQSSTRKSLLHKQQQQRSVDESTSGVVNTTPSSAEFLLNADELQQLKLLNRHSCNGRLDYEALERHLQQTELLQQQQNKGVEALGVLVQYLVFDLDAFSCASAKTEGAKAKDSLNKTLHLLDEAKNACTELQDQMLDKDSYYNQREQELQTLHRCELEKAQVKLTEFQLLAKEQMSSLQKQLASKDADNKRALECYTQEMEIKFAQKQQQFAELEERERNLHKRLCASETENAELQAKLSNSEAQMLSAQQIASEREQELNAHIKLITKELDALHESKDQSERELQEKLNLSKDEISVLRSSRKSLSEKLEKGIITTPRNSVNASEINRLQSEVDSLRDVLEMKQKDISKLTKQNEELLRDAAERTALQAKISLLESQTELLKLDVETKTEKEKEFERQMLNVSKDLNNSDNIRQRLSLEIEQLQYMLKQRGEQIQMLQVKLSSFHVSSSHSGLFNDSSIISSTSVKEEDIAPSTPVIKGSKIEKKNGSISWVLGFNDESAEAAVSKIVKRAGSFRSMERSNPSARRHLSMSATCSGSANNSSLGPNPLSQSMSAASVICPHSSEITPESTPNHKGHSRTRSKSVCIKVTESTPQNGKKYTRQHSANGAVNSRKSDAASTNWIGNTSSPYGMMRPRSSTLKSKVAPEEAEEVEQLFSRSACSKLITCDSSALNKGERLELHSLPSSHPSMHDLKRLKNSQEIQESAGEAMVSGTNSEDEGCSAYSDEMASSVSTSSGNTHTGSSSSLNQLKNTHLTLEEMLMEKIHSSLNGTPMEGSWSEDGEAHGEDSVV